jgi:hypothetical protein
MNERRDRERRSIVVEGLARSSASLIDDDNDVDQFDKREYSFHSSVSEQVTSKKRLKHGRFEMKGN